MATKESESVQNSGNTGTPSPKRSMVSLDSVRTAIPLGIAVVGGVFIALGIEGDGLSRLIRNSPLLITWAMGLAVLGVTLPLIGRIWSRRAVGITLAVMGSSFLIAGAVAAIWAGAHGIAVREQPDIAFKQLGPVASDSSVTFKVTATALSLRSDDHMLLRVLAMNTTAKDLTQVPDPTGGPCNDAGRVAPAGGRVLVWAEGGPSATGTVTTTATVTVSRKEFTHLCALAVLNTQPKPGTKSSSNPATEADTAQPRDAQPRSTTSIIDLRGATATPASSATPSPASGSVKKSSLAEEGFAFVLTQPAFD